MEDYGNILITMFKLTLVFCCTIESHLYMLIHVQQTPTKHKAAIEILTKVITITQNQSITDSGM